MKKKPDNFQSPDLNKLQGVIVDFKTRIYIPIGADADKARQRYLRQMNSKFISKRQ
jgi:hypothetical protein